MARRDPKHRDITRSEQLARRALRFALDPAVSRETAADRLIHLADGQAPTLELARAQILRAPWSGPTATAALGALQLSLRHLRGDRTLRLVILGPPGAGKGTQAPWLARHLGVPHISTGDLLREQATADTELGARIQATIESGRLVPDDLVLRTLETRLAEPDAMQRGYLLDGFPRTVEQARTVATFIAPATVDVVIALAVGPETVARRLALRGRADDTRSAVRTRLERYDCETVPALDWYEEAGLLLQVDGDRPPDRVREDLCRRIDGLGLSPCH
ncbi:MAG TPA: nucleoside monophosphate kinase [Acidimicrobiia bacterium]|jgi:adenylate kinase